VTLLSVFHIGSSAFNWIATVADVLTLLIWLLYIHSYILLYRSVPSSGE